MAKPIFKPRLPTYGSKDGDQVITSSGNIYEYNIEKNEWVCTGSQMGRKDKFPASVAPKLKLRRLPFVDGCYDRWGAYWGAPANVWLAWDDEETQLFRRGDCRNNVKSQIKKEWPMARFYR